MDTRGLADGLGSVDQLFSRLPVLDSVDQVGHGVDAQFEADALVDPIHVCTVIGKQPGHGDRLAFLL